MTSATTRDALGMKNDCWLRPAASWVPPSEFPLFFLKLWTVTIRAEVGLWESNKTAEQSSALSLFAKHTNTFWIDKTSILERHAMAIIQNEWAAHFPRCEKHSGVWWGGLTLKFAINQLILRGTQLERVNPTDCISTTFSCWPSFHLTVIIPGLVYSIGKG